MWVWARWLLSLLLQPGGAPQHVAFIMDGNRRFAAGHSIQKIQGHRAGYKKMMDVIHWCVELGVRFISVYAFSIDNFARSLEEVEALMQLAEDKYEELTQEDGLAERKGIEVRIIGDLSLAPISVQASANRLMQKTAALPAKQAVLNICFSYSSREELILSMDTLQQGIMDSTLQPHDVTIEKLHHCMRTQSCPPVDIVIRTSGETRASDFLLWQAAHANLLWEQSMWPDWGYLSFVRCILTWQLSNQHRQRVVQAAADRLQDILGMALPPSSLTDFTSPILPTTPISASALPSHSKPTALESETPITHMPLLTDVAVITDSSTAVHPTNVVRRRTGRRKPETMQQTQGRMTPLHANCSLLSTAVDKHHSSSAIHQCRWELPVNWAPHTFGPIVHALSQIPADLLRLWRVLKRYGWMGSNKQCIETKVLHCMTRVSASTANQATEVVGSIQMKELKTSTTHCECTHLLPPDDNEDLQTDATELQPASLETLVSCSETSDHTIHQAAQPPQQQDLQYPLSLSKGLCQDTYLMCKSNLAPCKDSATCISSSVKGVSVCSEESPCVTLTPTTPSSTPPSSPRTDDSGMQPGTCSDVMDAHFEGCTVPRSL